MQKSNDPYLAKLNKEISELRQTSVYTNRFFRGSYNKLSEASKKGCNKKDKNVECSHLSKNKWSSVSLRLWIPKSVKVPVTVYLASY